MLDHLMMLVHQILKQFMTQKMNNVFREKKGDIVPTRGVLYAN